MSLACRKWLVGYHPPSVWKTFRFALTNSQLSMRTGDMMKFVWKYSSMFRHVEIEYIEYAKKHLIKSWCRHFEVFLHILSSNPQLISVKFKDLSGCIWHIADTPTYDNICRRIVVFLHGSIY
ncbi:hypothetical protein AVEN_129370-1 [Araneus ventricosus]|uniref:Uncharacterized protein n=1 Tax=Araneus ventricosus TaxID=182803 RepID=A0A4Y2CR61_ARAVE|nr:hypothetical protein AVEN_129370-1 [Araneus ventricosus]